jgi:hypothetical protein
VWWGWLGGEIGGMWERVVLRYIKTMREDDGDWCEVYREGKWWISK